MRNHSWFRGAVLVAGGLVLATALLAHQQKDEPEPFSVTFAKIQEDIRARLNDYPSAVRNPEDPVDFGDAASLRRALLERVEHAYGQADLIVLRRMAGSEEGSATGLRRALLNRIEDAFGRGDLPILVRMELEERTRTLLDVVRYRARLTIEERQSDPLRLVPWFLPRTADLPGIASGQEDGNRRRCTKNADCLPGQVCGQDGKCERRLRRLPDRPRPEPPTEDPVDPLEPVPFPRVTCQPPNSGGHEVCESIRSQIQQETAKLHELGCRATYDPGTGRVTYSGHPECRVGWMLIEQMWDVFSCNGCSTAPPPDGETAPSQPVPEG